VAFGIDVHHGSLLYSAVHEITACSDRDREISINDKRGQTDITIMEAAIRSLGIKAAKGDARSQKIFFDVVRDVEKRDELIYRDLLQTAVEYKDHWHEQIERCEAQGIPAPSPLPHPDHIHIDFDTGRVAIWGPVDKTEKKHSTASMRSKLKRPKYAPTWQTKTIPTSGNPYKSSSKPLMK